MESLLKILAIVGSVLDIIIVIKDWTTKSPMEYITVLLIFDIVIIIILLILFIKYKQLYNGTFEDECYSMRFYAKNSSKKSRNQIRIKELQVEISINNSSENKSMLNYSINYKYEAVTECDIYGLVHSISVDSHDDIEDIVVNGVVDRMSTGIRHVFRPAYLEKRDILVYDYELSYNGQRIPQGEEIESKIMIYWKNYTFKKAPCINIIDPVNFGDKVEKINITILNHSSDFTINKVKLYRINRNRPEIGKGVIINQKQNQQYFSYKIDDRFTLDKNSTEKPKDNILDNNYFFGFMLQSK